MPFDAPVMPPDLGRDACYRALLARDARYDGRFCTAVMSTGVYCRPICPARPPRIENCLFLPSAAAAHRLGFRPCLRCRPEHGPGIAGWRGTASAVSRALRLIAEGALDEAGVEGLADRLGVTGPDLQGLFERHLGAPPAAVAEAHRLLLAASLIREGDLGLAEVARASGFGSVQRLNAVIRRTYGRSPGALRRTPRPARPAGAGVTLRLPFVPPYDWAAMTAFLGARAVPGVEAVEGDRYRRSFALAGAEGVVEVRPGRGDGHLLATIWTGDVRALGPVVARLRGLLDLDADMAAIDAHLARDPALASRVRARPGLRVPGAWDPFELAVRALLGQQITVAGARTLAGRLAARLGRPLAAPHGAPGDVPLLFPQPQDVAAAGLESLGLPRARAAALRGLANAVAAQPDLLRPAATLEATVAKLDALPGVGPWTAHYIAMRALGEPDAFPAADLGLLRAMATPAGRPTPARLAARAESWRPWRAYAAIRLWLQPEP